MNGNTGDGFLSFVAGRGLFLLPLACVGAIRAWPDPDGIQRPYVDFRAAQSGARAYAVRIVANGEDMDVVCDGVNGVFGGADMKLVEIDPALLTQANGYLGCAAVDMAGKIHFLLDTDNLPLYVAGDEA